MGSSLREKMEAQLKDKLEDAFESVVKQKKEYYEKHPQKIPEKNSINRLINSVAMTNSAISGGSSLIPGPWGMLAVIPELVLVIKNQIALIYDVAAANGKKELMTKDLAAMVFISSMGTSVGGLVAVQGGKYLIRRSTLQVFQKMIILLGGKITQQALKSTVSKWLPGVGAAAMAAWSNYMTRKIGNAANKIFSSEMQYEDLTTDVEVMESTDNDIATDTGNIKPTEFYRIRIMTNLMKIDGVVAEKELEFLATVIENSQVATEDKALLTSYLTNNDRTLEGIDSIAKSPDDAIALLADMTALAKVDGQFHITEKLYIKQIGKMLSFSENDIEEVINS